MFDDFPLEQLLDTIDWTPFFITWELSGKFPAILEDEIVGRQATDLYRDAQAMLKRIVDEKLLTAKATVGFWPAARVGADDIAVYADDSREDVMATLHQLGNRARRTGDNPTPAWRTLSRPRLQGSGLCGRVLRNHRSRRG